MGSEVWPSRVSPGNSRMSSVDSRRIGEIGFLSMGPREIETTTMVEVRGDPEIDLASGLVVPVIRYSLLNGVSVGEG